MSEDNKAFNSALSHQTRPTINNTHTMLGTALQKAESKNGFALSVVVVIFVVALMKAYIQ